MKAEIKTKAKQVLTWLVGVAVTALFIWLTSFFLGDRHGNERRWTVFTVKAIYVLGGLAMLKYADIVMFPKKHELPKDVEIQHRIYKVLAAGLIISAAILAG